ncbi:nucleoside triphosphate hydrolase [Psychromonas sp. PRT-SC03]|nr:nucleoside triphosphate hydrolase [Psychromonas sp. PRT-SC03]
MTQSNAINKLLDIMRQLRDPKKGCPWDKKQTFASIATHTLEEAYELVDAISEKDNEEIKGELGDLLFHIVFYAQIGKEQSLFDFDDIVDCVSEKLIRRHPHVFKDKLFLSDKEIEANWEKEKSIERQQKDATSFSVLDNIPKALPALNRAYKIQKRASSVGFDWDDLKPVVDKIKEELDEVLVEVRRQDLSLTQKQLRIEDELGDLMFATVNLVRHLKSNPESTLRQANNKFEQRFRLVERHVHAQGKTMQDCSLSELDAIWDTVKKELNS